MIIFYLISFHSSAPPYTPQAAWSSPWKENLVWKGRRPCPWDARFSRVSWEGTQCLGTLLEHAQATVVTSKTLWKMGCSSNVCYGLDIEIVMPDPPGLCYARNQTGLRWSFLALKFSYSKILSHFLFSLNGRSISSQSPATFFSVQEIQFFLFLEKIQRSFLCSEICFFLLLALWAVRKESVCLKSCSHWLQHKLFWVPCDNGSQLFWAAVSIYKPETFYLCLLLPPPFWTWLFDSSSLNNGTGEIIQMIFETGIGIIGYSSHQSSAAAAAQMPGNQFYRLMLMIYSITRAVVSLEQTTECVLLKL